MTDSDWIIIIMGTIYGVGEAIQLIYLGIQAKRTATALDRLENDRKLAGDILFQGFIGLSERLEEDPEAGAALFRVISSTLTASLNNYVAALKEDPQALAEAVEFTQVFAGVAATAATNALEKTASKVIDKEADNALAFLPKKYRKAATYFMGKDKAPSTPKSGGLPPL